MDSLQINQRLIMTPGPVLVDPRVSQAMSNQILGQFDPDFTAIMNDTMALIRQSFATKNRWAFPVDGTSRAGLEAVVSSIVCPGDSVLVPSIGRFGDLFVELAQRAGGVSIPSVLPGGPCWPKLTLSRLLTNIAPKSSVWSMGRLPRAACNP